jgi:hypothetical protein
MPYDDFEGSDYIYLQPSNRKNAYRFTFEPAASINVKGSIPYNTNVSSVSVSGFTDLGVECTSSLIYGTPTLASNVVTLKLDYPGEEGDYRLKFVLALDDESIFEKDFRRIKAVDY